LPLLQIIKIIPKQIHIQLKKNKNKKKQRKKKLRTAIEWDNGILPPSSIKRAQKEIAPLVKWSLRLPYTFLSVGSPFY
jgi:hypothetical protein